MTNQMIRTLTMGSLALTVVLSVAFGQADDLTVGGQTSSGEKLKAALSTEGEVSQAAQQAGQALGEQGQEGQAPEVFVTAKEGWQKKGVSRIYDAFDGRMIVNDVSIRPFRLSRREAMRKYDNGTHGDEVRWDGVPSRILTDSTHYIGPRTAANYDELKGLLFNIGSHPDGPQRFFDLLMVSLDWDGDEISWNPKDPIQPGVYRLTSLERRMFAFIMLDSLEIMRAYQNAEGKDLIPYEDRVDPPTGLNNNTLESRRGSKDIPLKGIQSWNTAISTGAKLQLERKMMAALAGTELADASWFPGGVTAIQLSKLGAPVGGSLTGFGLGAAAYGAGLPGGAGFGVQPGGAGFYPGYQGGAGLGGVPGGGYGGYGGGYGGFGGGAYGAYGGGAAAGLNPRGVNIRAPGGAYSGLGGGISPLGGSLGFAF